MLSDLKRAVCKANKLIGKYGAKFTWGNASAFDPSLGLFVIKPTNVLFEELQPEMMVVVSLDGQKVEGRLEPSVDSDIHRAIYNSWAFKGVSGVAHAYPPFATAFAEAGMPIPCRSMHFAELFGSDIPITEPVPKCGSYRYALGESVVQTVEDPQRTFAALINRHSPFAWGESVLQAVQRIVMLEEAAKTSYYGQQLCPHRQPLPEDISSLFNGTE